MRFIALLSTLLVSSAFAAPPAAIDLDRPGVLEHLQQNHPQQYQALTGVLRAWERMPCNSTELQALKARFDLRDLECGVMMLTSYPAKRHVKFAFDGATYAATIVLKGAEDFKAHSAIDPESLIEPTR